MLETAELLLALGAAALLTLPVAYNRERYSRIMGLRTFPLVAVGACGYVLVAQAFLDGGDGSSMARILQGLMTGIGFVGGGAILKGKDYVIGTVSAASIWVTGALGAAVALGQWQLAVALSVTNFLIVYIFSSVKHDLDSDKADKERELQKDEDD
ncbi:MAG: MgtC/SapB family protein [Gammaproteobacteria bacterium]|nr:MgtC/SapB family protein [Gammaproteobacteria bacterium]